MSGGGVGQMCTLLADAAAIYQLRELLELLVKLTSVLVRGMDKGTAKDFFSYFSGQRERNSEFTVGWLFVSILKK